VNAGANSGRSMLFHSPRTELGIYKLARGRQNLVFGDALGNVAASQAIIARGGHI